MKFDLKTAGYIAFLVVSVLISLAIVAEGIGALRARRREKRNVYKDRRTTLYDQEFDQEVMRAFRDEMRRP